MISELFVGLKMPLWISEYFWKYRFVSNAMPIRIRFLHSQYVQMCAAILTHVCEVVNDSFLGGSVTSWF